MSTALSEIARETRLVIADSYNDEEYRGRTLKVWSKGTVKCNGRGRCGGDHCIGLAVFLTDLSRKDDGSAGWRSNTIKVCLTHLLTEDGDPLVPPGTPRPAEEDETAEKPKAEKKGKTKKAKAPAPEAAPEAPPTDNGGSGGNGVVVSWEELAEAAQSRDTTRIAQLARLLKAENERLLVQLIQVQQKLIAILGATNGDE